MGNIGWTGIIIIAILVVILFGKGKISSIMGDLAKVTKSFKGMSDDNSSNTDHPNDNSDKSNSENSNLYDKLGRDFSNSHNCNNSFGTKGSLH